MECVDLVPASNGLGAWEISFTHILQQQIPKRPGMSLSDLSMIAIVHTIVFIAGISFGQSKQVLLLKQLLFLAARFLCSISFFELLIKKTVEMYNNGGKWQKRIDLLFSMI